MNEQRFIVDENDFELLYTIAEKLIKDQPLPKVIVINGDLGAGKTTLVKAFCKVLGVEEVVSSPTFTIVNEYTTTNSSIIFHIDLYRIESYKELAEIGIEEYLYSGNWCFIEWPEIILDKLTENFVFLKIGTNSSTRARTITYTTM